MIGEERVLGFNRRQSRRPSATGAEHRTDQLNHELIRHAYLNNASLPVEEHFACLNCVRLDGSFHLATTQQSARARGIAALMRRFPVPSVPHAHASLPR